MGSFGEIVLAGGGRLARVGMCSSATGVARGARMEGRLGSQAEEIKGDWIAAQTGFPALSSIGVEFTTVPRLSRR